MADYARVCLVVPQVQTATAKKILAEANFEPSLAQVDDADADECLIFTNLDDPRDVEVEEDGTYVRAWGGIMV